MQRVRWARSNGGCARRWSRRAISAPNCAYIASACTSVRCHRNDLPTSESVRADRTNGVAALPVYAACTDVVSIAFGRLRLFGLLRPPMTVHASLVIYAMLCRVRFTR